MKRVQSLDALTFEPEPTTRTARGLPAGTEDWGYDTVALNKMQFVSTGSVRIPGHGILRMTGWARRQIGNLIGVRWEKFFKDQDPARINAAVRNHLAVREDPPVIRVVARTHVKADKSGTDGLLRGVVSPTYSQVRDAVVLRKMRKHLGPRLHELGFQKCDLRDNGSHYTILHKDPIKLVGMPPNQFRGITPGHTAPTVDTGYHGLRLRNSEVGAYAYTADAYVLRLVCVNGMMMLLDGERIMKRKHVGIDDEKLEELVDNTFRALPKMREAIVAQNNALQHITIDDPEDELRMFLGRKQQPKFIQEAALKAYGDEPNPTAYGVLQAITRTGMALQDAPDRQHELELIAGEYISSKAA